VRIAGVKERPNDREAFAGMRMVRILDDDCAFQTIVITNSRPS